ncbi:hypothetical protein D3C85_1519730 [compost metagenome]
MVCLLLRLEPGEPAATADKYQADVRIVLQFDGGVEQRLHSLSRPKITRENNAEMLLKLPGKFGRNPLHVFGRCLNIH